MARLCRTKEAVLSLCKWSCLVVFAVGSVRDGVVFGCMHALVFLVSGAWVPTSWVNQVILHHEGRRNSEDRDVRDGERHMNEKIQTKGASKKTKHSVSARRDAGCAFGCSGSGNQSPKKDHFVLHATAPCFNPNKLPGCVSCV